MALMTEPTKHDDAAEQAARRRKRSIVLGLVLGAFVIIVYVLTIVKMGPSVLDRPL
jgi:t-SNARE complex subunit (syntaxin)